MEQTVTSARRLRGEICVPGELEEATRALVLASLSEGDSSVGNVPPGIAGFAQTLRHLGVGIRATNATLSVAGRGLRGLKAPQAVVDVREVGGDAGLLLMTALACQSFPSRVSLAGDGIERARKLLSLLEPAGVSGSEEGEGVFHLTGCQTVRGVDHGELDPGAGGGGGHKLALLLAGLYGGGQTTVRESQNNRDRVDHELRHRGVEIVGSRQDKGTRAMMIEGGQALTSASVEAAGQMPLALPLIIAALSLKGSKIRIRKVAVRPDNRAFLDLLRQLGAAVEMEVCEENGAADLVVGFSTLKSTRVAEKRAERLLDQVPLLAVLATQTEGEFIIRDIEALRERQEGYDFVAHLAAMLRLIDAKVGEYPEGLVIDGGHPLRGARIDTRGDAGMVQAFTVAGMLAHGDTDTEIEETQCLDEMFPGFFECLTTLRENKK